MKRTLKGRRNSHRFARSANRTKKINLRRPLMRGGYRL